MSKIVSPYGSWKSPITSELLTKGNCKSICELQVRTETPFWVEQTFPNGVRVLFERCLDYSIVQWSPDNISVKNNVHEFGGGSFCVGDYGVFISTINGIYQLIEPKVSCPITVNEEKQDYRYADLFLYKNFIFSVQERHDLTVPDAEPENILVKINTDTGEITIMAQGADFYAAPRVSPDGKYIAWMQWNKPNMPWDKTSIWLAELDENYSILSSPKKLLENAAYFAIQWARAPETKEPELYVTGDPSGFWNIYTVDIKNGSLKKNIYSTTNDLGDAFWNFGDDRAYAVSDKNFVVAFDHTNPVLLHKSLTNNSNFVPIKSLKNIGFTSFAFLSILKLSENCEKLYTIASGPKRSLSLVEVDLQNYNINIIRETFSSKQLDLLDISVPQLYTFDSDGVKVDGYFYPPYSTTNTPPDTNIPPPVVFFGHSGPTTRTSDAIDLKKQYYTTRGFAVFDINYRGSTGYGTEFRNYLKNNWGIVDVADYINGAKYLILKGLIDSKQICFFGSSAGGYLILSTLINPENQFKACVSVYGVTDLLDLFKCNHKFESKYNDQLIAPYPEGIEIYKQRSPIYHLDKIKTPIAFLHGSNDTVVSCIQSEHCFEILKKKGVPTALKIFEGESHGFRSSKAITETIDFTYTFFCRVLGIKSSVDFNIEIFNLEKI